MKTVVCWVCGCTNSSAANRCCRCAWEFRDADFFASLEDVEEQRYLERRDLARARWTEFHRYDQSPREGAFPVEPGIIYAGATSSQELPIGGGLL